MAYQPKSYRKFVATTATAAMVASAVAPVVSAAGFTDVAPQYKDAIDFLVSTGATNGKTDTKFGVYDEITRLDAAVILAKVLKLDVDNAKDAGFTDVPKDRAKYVNALVEAGVLNGKAADKFGSYDNLTRVEMAKIIANAYNLKGDDVTLPFTDVNDTWAPFVKALYKYEVTKGKPGNKFGAYENITRGDFAQFVYRAHNVTVAPEVTSVSAINATEVAVTFNKPVLESTAENKNNYIFDAQAPSTQADLVAADIQDIQLQSDGKTAIIRFVDNTKLVESTTYKVTVENVLTTEYEKVPKYEGTFTFTDKVAPVLSNAQVEDSNLLLTFNEEVDLSTAVLRVDGVQVSLSGAVLPTDAGDYKYSVALTGTALNEGTHTVTLVGVKDLAGNEAGTLTKTYTVSKDVTAPTVKEIKAVDADTFKVVFSEVVSVPTVKVMKGSTEFVATATSSTPAKEFTFDVASTAGSNNLYNTGENSISLVIEVSNFIDGVNLMGDKYTGHVTLNKDVTGPALLNANLNKVVADTANNQTDIEIPFNEVIQVVDPTKIKVINPDGIELTPAGVSVTTDFNGDLTVLKVEVAGLPKVGTYSVVIPAGAISDTVTPTANKNSAITTNVSYQGSQGYYVLPSNAVSVDADNNITIAFGKEVDSSALNISNYKIDNVALPAGTTAVFTSTAKDTVKLTLPSSYKVVSTALFKFEISNLVKTAAGEFVVNNTTDKANYVQYITLNDNVAPEIKSAKFTGVTSDLATGIEITATEALEPNADADEDDFIITVGSTKLATTAYSVTVDAAGKIQIALNPSVNVNQTVTVKTATTADGNTATSIFDAAGNELVAGKTVTVVK
jgi:S-layer homology domain